MASEPRGRPLLEAPEIEAQATEAVRVAWRNGGRAWVEVGTWADVAARVRVLIVPGFAVRRAADVYERVPGALETVAGRLAAAALVEGVGRALVHGYGFGLARRIRHEGRVALRYIERHRDGETERELAGVLEAWKATPAAPTVPAPPQLDLLGGPHAERA